MRIGKLYTRSNSVIKLKISIFFMDIYDKMNQLLSKNELLDQIKIDLYSNDYISRTICLKIISTLSELYTD